MDVTEIFGSNVFNDDVMQNRLPKDTYKALKKTLVSGEPLAPEVADVVADANLRSDGAAFDGHPFIVEDLHVTGAAPHDAHVADILSLRPVALVIDQHARDEAEDHLVVFAAGSIKHTSVLGLGGYHITNDIAIGVRAPLNEAERIKRHYGSCIAAANRESRLA